MFLYPGARELNAATNQYEYSVTPAAMAGSMAQTMEDEMSNMFQALKGQPLPDTGKEGRLMLFAAIARGVLEYLYANQAGNIMAGPIQVTLNVNSDHV